MTFNVGNPHGQEIFIERIYDEQGLDELHDSVMIAQGLLSLNLLQKKTFSTSASEVPAFVLDPRPVINGRSGPRFNILSRASILDSNSFVLRRRIRLQILRLKKFLAQIHAMNVIAVKSVSKRKLPFQIVVGQLNAIDVFESFADG